MSTNLKDSKQTISEKIFDEFFIIGLDRNALSEEDLA